MTACAGFVPPQPTDTRCDRLFYVSRAFTATEQAALTRATTRWNEIASEKFCTQVVSEAQERHWIYRIPYKGPTWQEISDRLKGADVLGVYYGTTDRIGIVDGMNDGLFELVALHELGHAHGLDHTARPAIMHGASGTTADFTPIDLAECRRVLACVADESQQEEDSNGGH